MKVCKVLVVDDEADMLRACRKILESKSYEVLTATDGPPALELLQQEPVDVMVLDLRLPSMDGLAVMREARRLKPDLAILMITAYATLDTAMQAVREGAFDFIPKPFSMEQFEIAVERSVNYRQLVEQNRQLQLELRTTQQFENVVAHSPQMKAVLDEVRKVAPSEANVLLCGESGTGKELIARCLHSASSRSQGPFVPLDCASLPETLLESELFGHEKGSFTGATEKQIGKFEQADRGTIFLDEIGDMSARTQAKVLRVLQEQEVERIGSARTIEVDVRVIAATNKDLEAAIQRSEFREDLYFRLNVIPIVVPPLRERPDDIPALVQYLARRTSEEHNLKPKRFDAKALEALRRHRWRGNIRELRNAIERLMIMVPGDVVRLEDLPKEMREEGGRTMPAETPGDAAGAGSAPAAPPGAAETLKEFKDAAERTFLVQKLRENNWNISKTAELIDTPRSNLYKKLEQYGIRQEGDG